MPPSSGPPDRERPSSALAAHLRGRIDGLTSAVLVFPLFVFYQVGILTGRGQNGVDFITRSLIEVSRRDVSNYLAVMAAMLIAYLAVLAILWRRGTFHPRAFLPMLVESTFYALIMGSIIVFVMSQFLGVLPGLSVPAATAGGTRGPLDVLVISAGAGFHEELIFRVGLMGGLAWALTGITGKGKAWFIALLVSSVLFSLAHHIGPSGEAFRFSAFTYRLLAGVFFAAVYQVRGFAVAAWTHTLYDVYVLSAA